MTANAARLAAVVSNPAIEVRSNVGRAILQRAAAFSSTATAVFEYVANAYEAYDQGQVPAVEVEVAHGKASRIVVRDFGCGMSGAKLSLFWTLNAETERRENGNNKRGHFGSGKIAAFAKAGSLTVRTVSFDEARGGNFANEHRLTMDAVRHGSANMVSPLVENLVHDEPTDEHTGTVVTIEDFYEAVAREDVSAIVEKIETESLMWLAGAKITVNKVPVTAPEVGADRIKVYEEGDFTATVKYMASGYQDRVAKVFYSCGGLFVARDDAGKEGHRLSSKVHVAVDTTPEWSAAKFENRREQFISESRDGKFQRRNADSKALGEFAERCVRAFLAEIEEEERAARRDTLTEFHRSLEEDLSRMLSTDWRKMSLTVGGTRKAPERRDDAVAAPPVPEADKAEREPRRPRPKVRVEMVPMANPHPHVEISREELLIRINTNHPALKALSQVSNVGAAEVLIKCWTASGYAELLARDEAERMVAEGKVEVVGEELILDLVRSNTSRVTAYMSEHLLAAARRAV